jgi:plasmid stabilization system protein ParE
MDFNIVWTEPAIADLDAILAYVAQQRPSSVEKVRDMIFAHVEILGTFPFIGPRYERDRRGRTREIVCQPYRILYRVIEDSSRVEILTIRHGARSEP